MGLMCVACAGEGFIVPPCPKCGGILKPDVVFFGDGVPAARSKRFFLHALPLKAWDNECERVDQLSLGPKVEGVECRLSHTAERGPGNVLCYCNP